MTKALCAFWIVACIIFPFSSETPYLIDFFQIAYHPRIRPTEILTMALAVYLVAVIIRAVRHEKPGARFMLVSIFVLLAAITHDILLAFFSPSSTPLSVAGMFAMLICQSAMLAGSFSRSFSEVERLSETLRQKNIALTRMDRIKDEFLANTSHELRTPLNGIMGITESLAQGVCGRLPQKAMTNLSLIFASAKRLAGLVNDLLDFSRLKNRDIKLNLKPVDINALTDAVLSVARNLAGPKRLEFKNGIPRNIGLVEADEDRLQQILYNLIGNAIKFTERGTITVGAKQKENMVEVWISDTGIGIPQERLDSIFRAFEQVDAGVSRSYEGTGLGLSISRHLVRLHGGDIRVKSALGRGSIFTFALPAIEKSPVADNRPTRSTVNRGPAEETPAVTAIESPASDAKQSLDKTPLQAFVVDDDPINLQVVANHLSMENITFQTATNGIDALGLIESGAPPHIMLLDIMMPKMSGYEVCRRVRKTLSPSELPIIILTAKNHVAELVEGFNCGANDYLIKPFSKDELIARVNSQLEIKEAYHTSMENRRLEREVSAQIRKKEQARYREEKARLEKLRYQINPHFLFNALTSIRGAILKDGATAREMVTALSEVFRLSLASRKVDLIPVQAEIKLVRHYITIEKLRMGDYLQISISVDPEIVQARVPVFCLQPLVENAIKYGKMTSTAKLEVRIVVGKRADRLRVEVTNSGVWVKSGADKRGKSPGIGNENIRTRLEKLYPGNHTFTRATGEGMVSVEIELPLSRKQRREDAA